MAFSLLHKLITYLLSGLGLAALSLGSEVSELTLGLMLFGFGASFFAEEKLHALRYYNSAWTAAVVGCLAVQTARGFSSGPTLAMAIEFAAFLQISRLFNRRTAVDYQQIAVLAFLHLTAATVLSSNLSYAAIFIGFVIATPWMLALSHLRREIEANYPTQSNAHPNAQHALRRVLASKRVVGASFLVGTALLAVPLFAMTLVIFVAIPRVGQGFLTFKGGETQRVAGFGNQVELGGFGVIRDDPTVVLRVMPLPPLKAPPPSLWMHMRGTSFDRYDGWRWTRTAYVDAELPRALPFVYPLRRMPEGDEQLFRVVLDHLDEPVVFLPTGTVALTVPPRVVRGQDVARQLRHAAGLDVRYITSDAMGLVYTAHVSSDAAEQPILPIAEEHRSDYLGMPRGHERIAKLAKEVVGDAASDQERADRIARFLAQGEYTYSLEQPLVGDQQLPLEVFLFDAKRGHCEYFSSAMAIMLRAVGVPSRNVTGFAGGKYNPYGAYYALRQGDAHSWVEAYLRERGWVTYDPTPSGRVEAGPKEGLLGDLNALVDALRTRWMTSVIGYDLRVQVSALYKVARFFSKHRRPDGAKADNPAEGPATKAMIKNAVRWTALGLVVGIFLWLLWRIFGRPSSASRRELSKTQARAVKLYIDLERALAKRGHPRPPASTPLEHAGALKAKGFAEHAEVDVVTQRYLDARYGGRPLRSAELKALRQSIDRIRKAA